MPMWPQKYLRSFLIWPAIYSTTLTPPYLCGSTVYDGYALGIPISIDSLFSMSSILCRRHHAVKSSPQAKGGHEGLSLGWGLRTCGLVTEGWQLEADSLPLTLASLIVASVATVVSFGILAFSTVPVLSALGSTVAPGAFLALIFSALLARHVPESTVHTRPVPG